MVAVPTITREDFLAKSCADPELFCLGMFPWQEPGTVLAEENGLDTWQIDVLDAIRTHLLTHSDALRIAVASGHGVGKTCLSAMLILWFLLTRPHAKLW